MYVESYRGNFEFPEHVLKTLWECPQFRSKPDQALNTAVEVGVRNVCREANDYYQLCLKGWKKKSKTDLLHLAFWGFVVSFEKTEEDEYRALASIAEHDLWPAKAGEQDADQWPVFTMYYRRFVRRYHSRTMVHPEGIFVPQNEADQYRDALECWKQVTGMSPYTVRPLEDYLDPSGPFARLLTNGGWVSPGFLIPVARHEMKSPVVMLDPGWIEPDPSYQLPHQQADLDRGFIAVFEHPRLGPTPITAHALRRFRDHVLRDDTTVQSAMIGQYGGMPPGGYSYANLLRILAKLFTKNTVEVKRKNHAFYAIKHDEGARYFYNQHAKWLFVVNDEGVLKTSYPKDLKYSVFTMMDAA